MFWLLGRFGVLTLLYLMTPLLFAADGPKEQLEEKPVETYRYDLGSLHPGHIRLAQYIVQSLMTDDSYRYNAKNHQLTLFCADLSRKLCDGIGGLDEANGVLSYPKLQKVWMDNFLETRKRRHNQHILKDQLADFATVVGYKSWPSFVVDSRIKRTDRRIYRGKVQNRAVSVAETEDSNGDIRETEIAIERFDEAGSLEFYTYDRAGKMALESDFPAGNRPSPAMCVRCHLTPLGKANRFIPQPKALAPPLPTPTTAEPLN